MNIWSQLQIRLLRELADSGLAPQEIAVQLGRTESAVRNKAGMLGISLQRRDRVVPEEASIA